MATGVQIVLVKSEVTKCLLSVLVKSIVANLQNAFISLLPSSSSSFHRNCCYENHIRFHFY